MTGSVHMIMITNIHFTQSTFDENRPYCVLLLSIVYISFLKYTNGIKVLKQSKQIAPEQHASNFESNISSVM